MAEGPAGSQTCTSAPAIQRPASFVMLGKTFKGLTDEMLRWQTQRLLELEDHRDRWTVYVRPELVARNCVRWRATLPALPGRSDVALRPRRALPRGQTPRRSRHS